MHALVATFRFLPMLCLGQFITACAQEFTPIVAQIDAVSDLNSRLTRHATATEQLLHDHNSTLERLQKSREDLQQINLAALRQIFVQWEADLNRQILASNLRLDFENNDRVPGNETPSRRTYMRWVQEAAAHAINLEQQSKQLSAAGQLTVERHHKIVRHLAEIAQQASALQADARELQSKYLEVAGVASVLSEYEHKATNRVLANFDERFIAAQLALALTHIRLRDLPAAEQVLERLNTGNDRYGEVISLSLQAEIASIRQDDRTATLLLAKQKKLYNGLLSSNPLIILLNAQTYGRLRQFSNAKHLWNVAIKNKRYPVAAHRGMAYLHIRDFQGKPNHARAALTHAKLASSLSADSDWSSQLVLALATAINGDYDKAAELAEHAAENAVLERKTQCLDAAEQLRNQKIPVIANFL